MVHVTSDMNLQWQYADETEDTYDHAVYLALSWTWTAGDFVS